MVPLRNRADEIGSSILLQIVRQNVTAAFLSAAFLLALVGCSISPKYHPPVAPAPAVYKESPTQFKETDGWKVAQPSDAMVRGKHPELNALEELLNIDNQNIKQFFENFMQAVRSSAKPGPNTSRPQGQVRPCEGSEAL